MSTYVLEANFTDLSQEIFDGGSNSSDPYGRTLVNPAENRIGQIKCNYDVDYDSDVDVVSYGTASLQHYDIIISCAHCIWDPQYADMPCDGWATEVIFYAGRTSNTSYAASANHVSMSVSQDFVDNSYYTYDENGIPVTIYDFNSDWSIIQIDKNLGGMYGWFGLHGCGEPELNTSIYTIGYPSDKTFGTQWKSLGQITSFEDNMMYYNAYIYPGNSGGPILNNSYVYGIATFTIGSDTTPWLNSGGTRIHDTLFSLIVGAREESAERWE